MLAGDVERRQAVARLQDAIAMGLEKIVKELHIQLIVLNHEDRLLSSGTGPGVFIVPTLWVAAEFTAGVSLFGFVYQRSRRWSRSSHFLRLSPDSHPIP